MSEENRCNQNDQPSLSDHEPTPDKGTSESPNIEDQETPFFSSRPDGAPESQAAPQNTEEKTGQAPSFEMPADVPLPQPTLITLATTIATQAMVSMGIFPNPITGQSVFMMNQAKHLIDTVQLLLDKTNGNRTSDESNMLENVVHELHMLFIAAQEEKSRREGTPK